MMRWRVIGPIVAIVLALTASACSGPTAPTVSTPPVSVDTQALRAQKAAAGIVTCPAATGHSPLPNLTLPCLGGGPAVDLDTLKGPLLINLWFANCPGCREEMPHLAAFYKSYGDKVPLLGVDIEPNDPSSDLALLADLHATYPQVADGDQAIQRQSSLTIGRGAPYTIFLSANGTHWIRTGPLTSVAQIKSLVAAHLGVRL